MSRATNQTLLLLSMVSGAVKVLEDRELLGEETRATALYAAGLCEQIIYRYPASGDEKKNLVWIVDHMHTWSRMIDETNKKWSPLVLAQISLNILSDLSAKIRNIDVLFDIKDLRDAFNNMARTILDHVGDEFVQMEEADALLNQMYRLIGFVR